MLFFYILIFTTFSLLSSNIFSKNWIKNHDKREPLIEVFSNDYTKKEKLFSWHLEFHPIFCTFDSDHFEKNLIKNRYISLKGFEKNVVSGEVLSRQIENLLNEIKAKKTKFKDFIILKNRDFNIQKQAGLIILKFKQYPFVIKLFMENPKSFIDHEGKGFEPACFFIVGGGINRHLVGFTRIKNKDYIHKLIEKDEKLKKFLSVPRKWFWQPEQKTFLSIVGHNIGINKKSTIKIPAIYGIICDYIDSKQTLSILNLSDQNLAIEISNRLLMHVDSHINNFLIEKDSDKIVIIDTEHFPTLVGLKEEKHIDSYFYWYTWLFFKGIANRFFRTKKNRLNLQKNPTAPFNLLKI